RPDRHPRQQRRDREARALRDDDRERVPPHAGRQPRRSVQLRAGGGAGDDRAPRRQDRQRLVAYGLGVGVGRARALQRIEGGDLRKAFEKQRGGVTLAAAEARTIVLSEEGPAARITLNRPEKRNALSLELTQEVVAALESLAQRADVRAVVVEGAGPAFSAGH